MKVKKFEEYLGRFGNYSEAEPMYGTKTLIVWEKQEEEKLSPTVRKSLERIVQRHYEFFEEDRDYFFISNDFGRLYLRSFVSPGTKYKRNEEDAIQLTKENSLGIVLQKILIAQIKFVGKALDTTVTDIFCCADKPGNEMADKIFGELLTIYRLLNGRLEI